MRERYKRCGMDAFAEHEALEVYLYRCLRRVNTNDIAHNLLEKFGSLSRVFSRESRKQYREVDLVGDKTAFIMGSSAENMERTMLGLMQDKPAYSVGKAMVFSRFMLRRIPEDHVLILRYDGVANFRDYTVLPDADDGTDWILQCLAQTKAGEEIHIRLPGNCLWTSDRCLKLGLELRRHARKLRSVHRISHSGETEVIYE